jgi:glucose/arabinose dehydrogenase
MTMFRSTRGVLAALAITATLAACSSDGDNTDSLPTAPIGTGQASTTTGAPVSTPETDVPESTGATPSTVPANSTPTTEPGTTAAPETTETTATTVASVATVGPTSPEPPDPSTLTFAELGQVSNPTNIAYRAGDPTLFVVSQAGFVVAMRDGVVDDTRLLDVSGDIRSGGERGLLGLAFSFDGTHAYVDYTNGNGDTEITEFAVGADGVFDPASKRLLLTIDQPYANHNGGQVRIGPDGYLYIGMGDGGDAADPQRHALNVGSLLGKLLRIDPNPVGDSPYSIPPDNPFIGVGNARTEIWSVGLRNPWRFSFDLATSDLWIADVGQGQWEEIDTAWADQGGGRAENFGWSALEGSHRFNEDQATEGAVRPFYEYEHGARGCSVSGGVRYRGTAIPALYGWYVYADYCNGEVRALEVRDDRSAGREVILSSDIAGISEVAQGPDGELYVLSVENGTVYMLRPAS